MSPYCSPPLGGARRSRDKRGVSSKLMKVIESLQIGDYKIIQDDERYRFTSDSVLLSRFLKAKKGERVADFCAGSGIVGIHFYAENPVTERVTLFEMQSEFASMSEESIALNGLEEIFTVENVRLQEISPAYTEAFSLILCNPPYGHCGVPSPDKQKATCKEEETLTLEELVCAAARCLKFGGRFALVYRCDKLSDLICTLRKYNLEPKKLQFVTGKRGKKPYLVLLAAVKGGKAGIEILSEAVNGT